MKEGYILKKLNTEKVSDNELLLINNYTRRELKKDEVYVFTVILCDNDIDRDFERFTYDSLLKLSELFVGKTGILDHEMSSKNQTARIFSCEVEAISGKLNSLGEPYYRLKARAYMPKSEKNENLILELDSGIKKEVSVGCSINKKTCSICGADLLNDTCEHEKGKEYDDVICHTILEEPLDAYEWSFVAVPAQKEAGVIKAMNFNLKGGVSNLEEIIKQLKLGEEVNISKGQAKKISKYISDLEQEAKEGRIYKEELRREVLRLSFIAQPDLDRTVMNDVTLKMNLLELKAFKKAFMSKTNEILPPKPQLTSLKKDKKCFENNEFKI